MCPKFDHKQSIKPTFRVSILMAPLHQIPCRSTQIDPSFTGRSREQNACRGHRSGVERNIGWACSDERKKTVEHGYQFSNSSMFMGGAGIISLKILVNQVEYPLVIRPGNGWSTMCKLLTYWEYWFFALLCWVTGSVARNLSLMSFPTADQRYIISV